jgi:putative membrane protein
LKFITSFEEEEKMRELTIASFIMAAAFALSVQAQSQDQSQNPNQNQDPQGALQDTNFIHMAAEGNLTQIELGKLGAKKSQNGQIQQFAQHLQTDHQSANQKLEPLAQSQGMQLPQTLDSKHQREISRLQKLSGAEFDKAFATTTLQDHARAITLYQKEAQQGQNPETKQYAENMLPGLQHHLEMAKETARSVGVSDTTISSILSRYPAAVGGASTPGGAQPGAGGGRSGY